MNDPDFDRELRRWLKKPPPEESLEEVVERLLNASPKKQESVREVLALLLKPEPSALTTDEKITAAIVQGWFALGTLLELGLIAKEAGPWLKEGVRSGRVSAETALRFVSSIKSQYEELERAYAPIVDALLKYEAKRARCRLTAVEAVDALEDEVFRLEVQVAARKAIL